MHTGQLTVGQNTLTLETGKLAKQADGAIIVRYGETVVIVTACAAPTAREGIDFLPLTVDYREYTYASGRIPGGFFKREGKPTEKEVLTSRFIDRPIRPLFPGGWNRETQVIALVLSADVDNDPDVLALTGASGDLEDPHPEDHRRGPRRSGRWRVRRESDLLTASPEPSRPGRRGQPRRDRDGRSRSQGGVRR